MSAFVDTNILIRHLTGDPAAMARRATAHLAEAVDLFLADLVVAETVYVLESFYEVPRSEVATAIRSLLAFPAVIAVDQALLLRAIEVYEVARIDSPRRIWWRAPSAAVSDGWHPSAGPSTGSVRSSASNRRSSAQPPVGRGRR